MKGETHPDRSLVAIYFGARLKQERLVAGLGQERLADLVGLHRTEISHLESARRVPRLHTVVKIAVGLEVEPIIFVTGIRWTPDRGWSKPLADGIAEGRATVPAGLASTKLRQAGL